MNDTKSASPRPIHLGFRTSIITVFIAAVLFVGLTLVYLSFQRVSAITQTAASTFIEKVAQLGADRIDSQFENIRDCLEVLGGLPSIQSAEIDDNSKLHGLMASMLRNNAQLFNLYVGYEDGSFLEMDVIDRANPGFRPRRQLTSFSIGRCAPTTSALRRSRCATAACQRQWRPSSPVRFRP